MSLFIFFRRLTRLFGIELVRLFSRLFRLSFIDFSLPTTSNVATPEYGKLCADLASSGFRNVLEITYPDSSGVMSRFIHVVVGSNFVQGLRWMYHTKMWSDYSDGNLYKFYQHNISRNYCGYSKLNNTSWCNNRLSQFEWLRANFLRQGFSNLTYLEFGGGTGFLPAMAVYFGFSKSFNYDLDTDALSVCKRITGKLPLLKENLITLSNLSNEGTYDVISCHQVIEHFSNPGECVRQLVRLMQQNSILIFSHGYKNPFHPGHIGSLSDDEVLLLFKNNGLILLDKTNDVYIFQLFAE